MSGLFKSPKAPKMPDPIDPGESMGEYLFGKGFSSYRGITDPRLQNRLIGRRIYVSTTIHSIRAC
jgi:hypothetical protein